jgi:hypothetical protein
MYLKLIWSGAILLVIIFAIEPYALSLIFGIPQSWDKFIEYMLDIPITILAVGLSGVVASAAISLIPIKKLSYKMRFQVVLPIAVSLLTTSNFGWIVQRYHEAQNLKKNGHIVE